MLRFTTHGISSQLIKQSRQIFQYSAKFSSAPENPLHTLHDRILYSSFLESQKLRLGYRKSRALQESLRKSDRQDFINRINIKPFSRVIQSISPTGKLEEVDQNPIRVTNVAEEKPQKTASISETPKNWMTDYEFYDESEEGDEGSCNGTPDPSIPPSNIPCSGCGAVLNCVDTGLPGYIPSEIFRGRTNTELKTIICQRCHFLKYYNIALDVAVSPTEYIEALKAIRSEYALAILIVDLLDFPCSIWPGIQEILGSKRPVFIVGNKVDLLPRDAPGYLNRIKDCLRQSIVEAGIDRMNIKHIALISAKTGYGIEELITQLYKIWGYEGDVYLVGCTNVGKSSLFNALLRSDYCKVQATELIQKATASPWPGTTLKMLKFPILRPSDVRLYYRYRRLFAERASLHAEEQLRKEQFQQSGKPEYATLIGHIGRTFTDDNETFDPFSMSAGTKPILTLNERDKAYANSKWCYDTPGVVHPDQILDQLTTEEIIRVTPSKILQPQSFLMKAGMSLFLSGLARLCFVDGQSEFIRVHVFTSSELPLLIASIDDSEELYSKLRGTNYLPVPQKDEVRNRQWKGLECSEAISITGEVENGATCDIILSSAGWVAIEMPMSESCTFRAWTPQKRGIHVRNPALISQTFNLRGSRIRGSLAYKRKLCKI